MVRKKLKRFAELKTFENVLEFPEDIKGKWGSDHFENDNPIVLELGCGKGEYSLGMAQFYPDKNFIGADIQGERLWVGAKEAVEQKICNIVFLRIHIEHLNRYFERNEISEIWITFPDPYRKKRSAKKRLTSPHFLEMYKKIVQRKGEIHLKTDSSALVEYSIETLKEEGGEIIEKIRDIYSNKTEERVDSCCDPVREIKTYYEKKHLKEGRKINYLRFRL